MNIDEVLSEVQKEMVLQEGACGICHLGLKKLSESGGKAVSREMPEGIEAKIIDSKGKSIGKGIDIVWPPAILKAQIDAGIIPETVLNELNNILTSDDDRKKVSAMYGYGRVIAPAGTVLSLVWGDGGRVEIKREEIGIAAYLYDNEGKLISDAVSAFCPICAINIAASRNKRLFNAVKKQYKDAVNTGKIKYERGIENMVYWDKRRVFARIIENEKTIGENFGCCISYATIRAEIAAGFGNEAMNRIFKNYCDICPLKCFWLDKAMGAMGNIVLNRMKDAGLRGDVLLEDYITVHLFDGDKRVAQGIGSLCSLSATVNAFLRGDAVKILKPPEAPGFPCKKTKI
ncbi:MAG: hypothetical protein PQ964_03820 [Methanobacteriaceae archaeon]|jgi:hypothetical protein